MIKYLKQQPAILWQWIKELSLIGFFKSIKIVLFRSIKQPAILHGYFNLWFARIYKAKRELFWHRSWDQMGRGAVYIKVPAGKIDSLF